MFNNSLADRARQSEVTDIAFTEIPRQHKGSDSVVPTSNGIVSKGEILSNAEREIQKLSEIAKAFKDTANQAFDK